MKDKHTMEIISEDRESTLVYYYCIATDNHSYDITIIYSNFYFGKAMVVSIQTKKIVLMCQEDIENEWYWVERLGINPLDISEYAKCFYG
ncbi:SAV0927 family protein [Bacillus sp. SA1-12]|uniref:SAV0927 family protein n=1 Tax=Bacillus sp. SA1-12 TaxID=1455638 RepID=UPI00069802B1|nr:SAV0927 family protein [Bacillus sp. SA1-12]